MKIFISYRRDDTLQPAGRLCENLSDHFGRANVFMDIESIDAGEDFVTAMTDAIGQSDIMLVLIGKQWLTASSTSGRRLDDPDDFVRLELVTASTKNIRVIPVLVQNAAMPQESELPEAIAWLSRRNAVTLRDESWRQDVTGLKARIGPQATLAEPRSRLRGRTLTAIAMCFVIALSLVGYFALIPEQKTKKLVVLMDSYADVCVFDKETREKQETNAHVIERILEPYSDKIRTDKELVSASSYDYRALIEKDPDLVVLHKSSFYGATIADDPNGRLFRFLRDMSKTKAKFLIYTRSIPSDQAEKSRWKANFVEEVPELEGRLELFTFDSTHPPSFLNGDVAAELTYQVKQMVNLQ